MNKIKKIITNKAGAAALIASIIVSAGLLSIILSTTIIALNNKNSLAAFTETIDSFYSAEFGIQEALLQVKRDPNNLTFPNLSAGDTQIASQFVETQSASCSPPLECQFIPGSGWWGEYFNYSVNHPDMELPNLPSATETPTEHDWYNDTYKTHEQIDQNIIFPLNGWFPYDGTQWENKEGFAHDYFFGAHWRAQVFAPAQGNYAFSLASDDDSWALVNGVVAVNNSGAHASFTYAGNIFLNAGLNVVELYFAERHTVESGFSFSFSNPNLVITPFPEGCNQDLECNSNIETSASSTKSSRKLRYTCNNDLENCTWKELIP
ncbi:hypothetical protein KBC40_00975 [Patescibacteria group bacterium]|nr:hypothetical protein [Patescibacteria group bacterium]